MTRTPRQITGAVLRNVAVLLTQTAERLDPQPPIHTVWPFSIQTGTVTKAAEARITWHERDFKETC